MKLINSLTNLGAAGISDEEVKSRIRLTNKISFVTAILMIIIGPILITIPNLFIPLLLDFILKLSVIFFNKAQKFKVANTLLFFTQAVAIGYFGYVLAPILQLEYAVVLLIAVNYFVFKTKFIRRIGLAIAIIDLGLIEFAHYKYPFGPVYGLSYDMAFLIHTVLMLSLFIITIMVIISYAQGNDLRFKLERANNFIKLFVNTVTHELKTPINALYQTNYFLQKEIKKDSPIKSIAPLANIIENASNQTFHIINNVLSAAKIETGRSDAVNRDTIQLLPYLSGLIELHKAIAKIDEIEVDLTIEDMPSLIIGDQFDLTLIISNLLSNAIKYGKKGGTVSIDIRKINEDQWVLKVINPGKGIPPDKIGTIFNPFVSNRSGSIQGTGLGLYIVKTKVEAMNGSILVVSDPDIFTQFTITLPLKEGSIKDLPIEERVKLQNDFDPKKIHIMVAEDHNMAVAYLKMLFAEISCKGTFLPDGSELLKAAAKEQPDIIMLDYNLPVLNGEETIRQLKKDSLLKDIPIIVTSSYLNQKTIDRMMVAGADAYMEKTPDKDTLIKTIKLYLKQDRRISIKKGSLN